MIDDNPQQGGKKGKDKNKDVMGLIEEWLVEINATMLALTGWVDDMDKRIEELKSEGDMEEFRGEMQIAMASVMADFKKELQALQASEVAKDGKLQACKAKDKACKVEVEA